MSTSEKRTLDEAESILDDVRSIIVDIEGTTTPISFVKDTLFPYAEKNVEKYVSDNFEKTEVQKAISALRAQALKDKEEKLEGVVDIPGEDSNKDDIVKAVCDNVKWQMGADRKSTELKALQGMVWKQGYESGEIKGELFQDAGPMLKMLAEEGFVMCVFSSGSVEAQRLLFTHSSCGDLSDVFTNYFDTTTGSKTESASYKKIAAEIGNEPKDILFLTDNPEEAEAAHSAGMKPVLVERPGNAPLTEEQKQKFNRINRFEELYGDEEDPEDIKKFAGDGDDDEDDEDEDDDGENDEEDDEDENPEDV